VLVSELKWKRKSPPQISTNDDAQPLRTWPIAASHNFTLLILQRRLSWLAYSSGSDCLQARASAAPPGDGIRHGVAFMPGGGCALPGLRSYDLH
jgi:hypothetical protein